MASVKPAALVARLEEVPDILDVGVAHCVIGVRPVHPLPQADRLFRLSLAESVHPLPASPAELCQPEFLNLTFGVQPQVAFDLDLHP